MGTQQLLIIAVGIFVVAIMIYTGVDIAVNYYQSSNREQLIVSLNDLGLMAQQYYRKPREQGGGGGSYLGWSVPAKLQNIEGGTIQAVVSDDRVNFSALGTEIGMNEKTVVRVTCRVDQNGIRMVVTN